MSETETPVEKMSFEEAMRALEQVVGQLERGDVALEDSRVRRPGLVIRRVDRHRLEHPGHLRIEIVDHMNQQGLGGFGPPR